MIISGQGDGLRREKLRAFPDLDVPRFSRLELLCDVLFITIANRIGWGGG